MDGLKNDTSNSGKKLCSVALIQMSEEAIKVTETSEEPHTVGQRRLSN